MAVAVVGALSEFGAAIARSFADRGAALALADRDAAALTALARSIEDDGARALALPTDVGDERQARALVEHTYEHLGRLDVLVDAAALQVGRPLEAGDAEAWRAPLAGHGPRARHSPDPAPAPLPAPRARHPLPRRGRGSRARAEHA